MKCFDAKLRFALFASHRLAVLAKFQLITISYDQLNWSFKPARVSQIFVSKKFRIFFRNSEKKFAISQFFGK